MVWARQERSFVDIKQELTKPTVLALYDRLRDTKVSADASSYGLRAVLLQAHEQTWKPVSYASRSLSDAEKRYAQIKKRPHGHVRNSVRILLMRPQILTGTGNT